MSHFIRKCECGVVIAQCRCPSKDKALEVVRPCRHGSLPIRTGDLKITEAVVEGAPAGDEHEGCRRRIHFLESKVGELATKYDHLNQVYNKLADQWNVFQATSRPDNRNIQRAEGAGEMARKLAEVLLGVAYDKDVRDALLNILTSLEAHQGAAGGREVEVGGKLERRAHDVFWEK